MTTPAAAQAASAAAAAVAMPMSISLFGYSVNLLSAMIIIFLSGLFFLFWRIQQSSKLDFADMITKDGRAVSLTKVLQLIGGTVASWVVIKMAATASLNETIFGIYLTYVAGVEGYSKFVAAKYGYSEKSVKDAARSASVEADPSDPSLRPPKV
jgi:hypothetical protein